MFFGKKKKVTMSDEIDRLVEKLNRLDPGSSEYKEVLSNLEGLCNARSFKSNGISPDVVVGAIANILGIILVLNYEQIHVIGSKAFSLIFRPRG